MRLMRSMSLVLAMQLNSGEVIQRNEKTIGNCGIIRILMHAPLCCNGVEVAYLLTPSIDHDGLCAGNDYVPGNYLAQA
jgi:hypothetical protein